MAPGQLRLPAGSDAAAVRITGLTADSREVRPGFLFAALSGLRQDGASFIPEALRRGAVAILSAPEARDAVPAEAVWLADAEPRRRLALLAARFFGRQPARVVAVTGTNGKTSTAVFTQGIWASLGLAAASLGTLGLLGFALPAAAAVPAMTTPDPVALQRGLSVLADAGCDRLAMEASSHGLAQFRLDGVTVAGAAFTNLTRDHLDYHGSMAAYRDAKLRLFDTLLSADGTAVVDLDAAGDISGAVAAIAARRGQRLLRYGTAPEAELHIAALRPHSDGTDLDLDLFGTRHSLTLPLIGGFQLRNALAALSLVLGTEAGLEPGQAVAALRGLHGVPGRMQKVASRGDRAVYVDYAHTPDALRTVLDAARPHCRGRLHVVFGAGGDRDPGKRPQMGRAAAELADRVIVTDDNPRSEAPAAIRAAILDAAPEATEIGDREAAIAAALDGMGAGDLLILAGKGHETGQVVAGRVLPFDDAEVARRLAAARGWEVLA
ncbi:MAG: UDP-N-acetylmuramoyl-L-alanyl-D-glutamate--2,6-diaminopimelate ligase [Sneathiellaceae bacterium]